MKRASAHFSKRKLWFMELLGRNEEEMGNESGEKKVEELVFLELVKGMKDF